MINTKTVKKQFEKGFENYDNNAVVQSLMADKLAEKISNVKQECNSILELGAGTGMLTKRLVKNIKFNRYYSNDLTEKSKKYIEKIIPDAEFYCGNALKINPVSKFDLIVSNAMFQWLNFEDACKKFKTLLNKDGLFAFSTFSKGNFKEIAQITGLSLDYMDLKEIKRICSKYYQVLSIEEFEHILEFNNPLELLAHMKNTGVNSLSQSSWSIKDVKSFCDEYSNKFDTVRLTYKPVIVLLK